MSRSEQQPGLTHDAAKVAAVGAVLLGITGVVVGLVSGVNAIEDGAYHMPAAEHVAGTIAGLAAIVVGAGVLLGKIPQKIDAALSRRQG